jgi:hypothetical protein
MMQLLVWAKAVYNAQERIYLISGKYSSALSDLDVQLPITYDKYPELEDPAEVTGKVYLLKDKYEFGWNWTWAGGKGFPIVFNQKQSVASQAVNPTYFIIVKSGAPDQCDGRQHCIVCLTYNIDMYNTLCESLGGKLIPNLSNANRAYYVLP